MAGGHLMTRSKPSRMFRLAAAATAAASMVAGPAIALAGQPTAGTPPTPGTAGVCSKSQNGGLVNCPSPPHRPRLPAGTLSRALVIKPATSPARLVDTRTWTTGGGNTYPGAELPFGMIQWSPDTLPHRTDGGGYWFGDRKLAGYSLTHLSGTGCPSVGDVPILPMTGRLPNRNPSRVATAFSHSGEVAHAGYYSARSNGRATITSQFSAAEHSAIGKFTFPRTRSADFLIKLRGSETSVSGVKVRVVGRRDVQGSIMTGNFCKETREFGPQRYRLYFDLVFNRPFRSVRVVYQRHSHSPEAVFASFSATASRVVYAKVAISYVGIGNARLNWRREIPGWDLAHVTSMATSTWNALLTRIAVSGGSVARTREFYSLLYKSFLQPEVISDVNGQYRGADLRIHALRPGQANQYGMFSGWDSYHALAQLQAMLEPGSASDMAQSLVNYYSQNKILPQWAFLYLDNYAMVGDPADALIADYYAFGARRFNTSLALRQMLTQATTVNRVRPGTRLENRYGYLPQDGRYGCCRTHGYVSSLLEYDNADFALAMFDRALGDPSHIAAKLLHRANNWRHIYDRANHLFVPRFKNGKFLRGIKPATYRKLYIEGDAYEYLWDVPNNYAALFALLGGYRHVRPALKRYLSRPDGQGMFARLGNEFDLGEQNALDYARDPADTQRVVSNIRDHLYLPGPGGFRNNDDLGAESSQYIWEMLGMYPENPGSGTLVFASPGFPRAVIRLPGGRSVTISAPGASATRFYVRSLAIDGAAYSKLYVPFSVLAQGGTLAWQLGRKATSWGTGVADTPPSYR
jgi:predicted alpha-1,2-mannosidase